MYSPSRPESVQTYMQSTSARVSNDFTISNCYTDGNVVSNSYVGGLIGYSLQQGIGTLIDSCFSSADVEGNNRVGGLIGYSQNTDIVDSGASGKIYGTNNVGGIVGYAFSHFMDFSMNNLSYSGEIVTSGNSIKSA